MSKAMLLQSTAGMGLTARARVIFVHAMPTETDPDAWLVQHADGRVFVTLASKCSFFAEEGDDDALPAFSRAFRSNPDLFRKLDAPKGLGPVLDAAPGLTADLTDADRSRLRQITMKHWRRYFGAMPTQAQVDQLIDSLGVEVATKLTKAYVDKGAID